MMSRIHRRALSLFGISAGFVGVFAIAEGCGSDSFTASPSTDGGEEGSTATDAGPADSGPVIVVDACVKPPTVATDETDFCVAFADISSRCMDCDPCRQQNANTCDALGAALSESFKRGFVACKDVIKCSEFELQSTLPENPCVAAYIRDGGVDTHQVAARDAYCGNCADASADDALYCNTYFGAPDGGGGIGGITLLASDKVADSIALHCNTCDILTYPFSCSLNGQFCAVAGKDQCGSGLCTK